MLTLNDEKSRKKLEEDRKKFEHIKTMSREDLEHAYYGSTLINKDYKQALIDIREYINGAYEMSIYTKSVSLDEENIEDILQIIDKVLGDEK